ncbi:MAG: hypothetical protein KM296_00120 [Brockia lithotrophica]|nr:hypothetical protein [Brockia lithotrophica]
MKRAFSVIFVLLAIVLLASLGSNNAAAENTVCTTIDGKRICGVWRSIEGKQVFIPAPGQPHYGQAYIAEESETVVTQEEQARKEYNKIASTKIEAPYVSIKQRETGSPELEVTVDLPDVSNAKDKNYLSGMDYFIKINDQGSFGYEGSGNVNFGSKKTHFVDYNKKVSSASFSYDIRPYSVILKNRASPYMFDETLLGFGRRGNVQVNFGYYLPSIENLKGTGEVKAEFTFDVRNGNKVDFKYFVKATNSNYVLSPNSEQIIPAGGSKKYTITFYDLLNTYYNLMNNPYMTLEAYMYFDDGSNKMSSMRVNIPDVIKRGKVLVRTGDSKDSNKYTDYYVLTDLSFSGNPVSLKTYPSGSSTVSLSGSAEQKIGVLFDFQLPFKQGNNTYNLVINVGNDKLTKIVVDNKSYVLDPKSPNSFSVSVLGGRKHSLEIHFLHSANKSFTFSVTADGNILRAIHVVNRTNYSFTGW